jgi:hypothetical protein
VLPLTVGIATEEERAGLHVRLFDKNDLSALCRSLSVNVGQCRSMLAWVGSDVGLRLR